MDTTNTSCDEATPRRYKRKQLFVDGFLQGRTLRHIVFYWTVYHLFLWNAMFFYRYLQYRGELMAGGRPQTFIELYRQFALEHYSMIVCAMAILPLVVWDVLVLTHKIAGPLVRFQKCLKQLSHGERVTPVQLRRGDLLLGFQDAFNEYIASLDQSRDRKQGIASGHSAPKSSLESWQAGPDNGAELMEELRQLQADLRKPSDGSHTSESTAIST